MEKRIGTHLVFLAALIVSVFGQTIRLVNSGVGRIEVFRNGTWGTVCDDGFGADEAKVACRQLGRYKSGLTPRAIQRFGFGGGKIWLDDVSCSGTESSLASCSHRPWGDNNCGHSEDVGIICDPIVSASGTVIHLEPPGSVLNVLLGQVISVVCVVDYSNSPVTSYRWTHSGRSYSGQTFSKTVTSKSDSGSLTCSVGNVHASTRFNVWYPPVVHMEPRNGTLNVGVGEDLSVRCVVDDGNPSVNTVRWSHNGQTSTGSTFLKRNITKSDQGQLTCTADNGHMMTPGRAVATVNVRYPPVVHMEPQNGTLNVGVGEDFSVRCVVDDGNPSVNTVRWSHNGQTVTGHGSTFLKRNITKSDQGQLSCTADNGHMMTPGRAVATVNVRYPPEIHLSPRQDVISVMAGDAVEVECVVDDANPAVTSYTWCHNNNTSHGQTFMKHVSSDDAGNLSCSATNEQGTSTVETRINVLQVSSLIGSDDTTNQIKLIAIVTGSVGIVTIIILIIIVIHLRRRLHAAKSEHEPKRSERTSRADEIPARCCNYETMERPSGGAENTYCEIGLSQTTGKERKVRSPKDQAYNDDGNSAHVYGNTGFEDEENIRKKKGKERKVKSPKDQAYNDDGNPAHVYGNTGFEDEENIRKTKGKERKVKSPEGQAYNDEPVYQNTTSRDQSSM